MKIVMIYSNPHDDVPLQQLADSVEKVCEEKYESINRFNLSDLKLKYCTGCWSCWWKTPGDCVIPDGISEMYKAVMGCDLVVFVSALDMGAVTSEMKTFIERMVPLIHPYTVLLDGEVHHRKRYDSYPLMGAILGEESDTDEEDRKINIDYFNRIVKNFYSKMNFVEFSGQLNVEAVHELFAD